MGSPFRISPCCKKVTHMHVRINKILVLFKKKGRREGDGEMEGREGEMEGREGWREGSEEGEGPAKS